MPAYASFGRRVAALAIDSSIVLAAVVLVIVTANAVAGPVLSAFWTAPVPVRVYDEIASRTSERQDVGTREIVISRQTRFFADGTVRIYLVAEARTVTADGTVSAASHVEDLIGRNARDLRRAWLTGLLGFVLAFAYFAGFEASSLQATPGKAALGVKVVDLAGHRISLRRSLGRQAMKCLELVSSGITYVIAAFTSRHQALHDMFAGTLVLQTAARPLAVPRRAAAF